MAKKVKQTKEKPLEKMTAIELREMAKQIEGVTGVAGMNKSELISAVKAGKGIEDEATKSSDTSTRASKAKIRELKKQRTGYLQESNEKMADIARRRISRLKKKTRRAAL